MRRSLPLLPKHEDLSYSKGKTQRPSMKRVLSIEEMVPRKERKERASLGLGPAPDSGEGSLNFETEVVSEAFSCEEGVAKRLVCKALYGAALQRATFQELDHTARERADLSGTFKEIRLDEGTRSARGLGLVTGYAANTTEGLVRSYNEDRVSILLNIVEPTSRRHEKWPKCSFFGLYDGHGGAGCTDFLRDHLHHYVVKQPSFPWNPKEALRAGFKATEKAFWEASRRNGDCSGSCALVVLVVGSMCYTANVGDSRAVLSSRGGSKAFDLSRDHKPTDEREQQRILARGGKIIQS